MVDFLVIGPFSGSTYLCMLHQILKGKVNIGYNKVNKFDKGGVGCYWYSTFDVVERPFIELCEYKEGRYKKFDYFDAINIDNVQDIPDYPAVMGVPVTFLERWNKNQFEIVDKKDCTDIVKFKNRDSVVVFCGDEHWVDGKGVFTRILIRKRV